MLILYEDLNSEYTYIDFRHASQYTLFLLDKTLDKDYDITSNILHIGYMAQEICLLNSKEFVYNRPVKQVINPELWKKYFSNNFDIYIPFYAVITGFYD